MADGDSTAVSASTCLELATRAHRDVMGSDGGEMSAVELAEAIVEQFRELLYRHVRARGEGPYYLLPEVPS